MHFICKGKRCDFKLSCKACKNEEFITHANGDMQCSKCGKYIEKETLERIAFAKKYDRDIQEPALKKIISEKKATLIMTIQATRINCKDISPTEVGVNSFVLDSRIDIYKAKDSVITAYYLKQNIDGKNDSNHFSLDPDVEILIISNQLPRFVLEGHNGGAYRVPVSQEPDKVVFTGATVGGITTGGFHTQPGKINYEVKSYGAYHYWMLECYITNQATNMLLFKIWTLSFRVFSYVNTYPGRYKQFFMNSDSIKSTSTSNYIWSLPENSAPPPVENNFWGLARPDSSFPLDEIMHELIYQDAVSDDEYYYQACKLLSDENRTFNDLEKAGAMFCRLGAYKDSQIKMNTCFHELSNGNYKKEKGCYIATAVYGSYDCPQVWTLRRYRDYALAETWYGRAFIHTYYAISPTLVKWFGTTEWFKSIWKPKLDKMVKRLNDEGVADTPYQDRKW